MDKSVRMLLTRTDEVHCFRLLKQHVYYISETNVRLATNMSRDNLISVGTCMGKFTKSGKFHLTIHCLDYMSEYAKVCVDCCLFLLPRRVSLIAAPAFAQYKVWVKPSSEMSFLYGNNIPKSGIGRLTDDIPKYAGVVVYNMSDVPLGFGVAAQSTAFVKELDPTAYVVLHQGDVGEYLRFEDAMF